MTKTLKQPFIHIIFFGVLIAVVLFILYGVKSPSESDKKIIINDADFAHLLASYEKTWQRPPTKEEFQNVLKNYVRDQVVYREALSQHLDENNAVVKRSLILQMNMLAESQGSSRDLTEADLEAYYDLRKDNYRKPAEVSFSQVYFSFKDNNATTALNAIRNQLNKDNLDPKTISGIGESIMLKANFENIPLDELDQLMGGGFSTKLLSSPKNTWVGPIPSSYGNHLVFIQSLVPEGYVPMERIRNELLRELQYEEKAASKEQFYTELMQEYEIIYNGEIKELVNEN